MSTESMGGIAEAPVKVCCICGVPADDKHHEPPRSLLSKEDYDNPKYHRYMCRKNHEERHKEGYYWFKARYPQYDGVSITEYRAIKRQEKAGKF